MLALTKRIKRLASPDDPFGIMRSGVVVELHPPSLIIVRQKKRKHGHVITAESLFWNLCKRDVERHAREKKKRRTRRKTRKERR